MIPNVRLEAEFLRAALLLGLIPESEVVAWADSLIATDVDASSLVLDLSLTRPELSALRGALWHLTEPNDLAATGRALLTFMAADDVVDRFTPAAIIGMLQLMRTDKLLPAEHDAYAKELSIRLMFVNGKIEGHTLPTRSELRAWLDSVRGDAYFRVTMHDRAESGALVAALSRRPNVDGIAWRISPTTIVLDEAMWRVMQSAFTPIPTASRIPYSGLPDDAVVVLDTTRRLAISH